MKGLIGHFEKIREPHKLDEQGFSLIELVVTVGILSVLTAGGTVGYSTVMDQTRSSATNAAASDVRKQALVYLTDDKANTTAQTAKEEYMESQKQTPENKKIHIKIDELTETQELIVTARYSDEKFGEEGIEAIRKTSLISGNTDNPGDNTDPGDSTNPGSDEDDENDEIIVPDTTPVEAVLYYRCEGNTAKPTPFRDSDRTNMTIENLTTGEVQTVPANYNAYTMKLNQDYKVTFGGKYTSFTGNNCLRRVESFGMNSGVVGINDLGANIIDVPKTLPSTVVDIYQIFWGSTSFNDPDVSEWDISNITSLGKVFEGASSFNQPLNKWNTSNVTDMEETFKDATSFNQNLSTWDTRKVTSMQYMFYNATSFNNGDAPGVSTKPLLWDTRNLVALYGIFWETEVFEQDVSSWNTDKLQGLDTDYIYIFHWVIMDNHPEFLMKF